MPTSTSFMPCRRTFLSSLALAWFTGDAETQRRYEMVRQIEARGVRTEAILAAMREVPRHLFVPDAQRNVAYEDMALGIGFGATISQPYIVAQMTELLNLRKTSRVFEVGTGSGYHTAVLSRLCEWVFSVELVPELARSARARLEGLGYRNTTVQQRDGYDGWSEHAPFDRLLLTACPAELPDSLVRQLSPGGRLVAPLGPESRQELTVIDKTADGDLVWKSAGPVAFLPMRHSR